jgi:drug/metabolite transporter (DMT)-like permease
MSPQRTRTARTAAAWMLAGSVCFASMGGFTHALGPRCHWLITALVRAIFMFLTTAGLARLAGVRLAVWNPPTLWVRSLAGSFSLVCNFYAMTRLPVADALTLTNTYPLWIVLLAAVVLRQAPRTVELAALACGMAGVLLIEQPHLGGERLAMVVALMGAGSTAVALLGLHRLRDVDTRAVVAHFAGVASLVSLIAILLFPATVPTRIPDTTTLGLLLGVAASGTGGQYCLTRAYAIGRPASLAIVGLTQIVFAVLFDVVFWGRALDPATIAGFALVALPSAALGAIAGQKLRGAKPEPERPRA